MDRPAQDQRKYRRFAFNARCHLRSIGGIRRQVRTVDLSPSGIRVEAMHRILPESAVSVDIMDYRNMPAHVVWATDSFVGIAFDYDLHPAIFDAIVSDELPDNEQDFKDLADLAQRAIYEATHCYNPACADHAKAFGADLKRASAVNRLVQGLQAHASRFP